MKGMLLYVHTIRHLRGRQLAWRALRMMRRRRAELRPAPRLGPTGGSWTAPARRAASMTGLHSFVFLNRAGSLDAGWDDPAMAKLWRYNLHYFDDLHAEGADDRQHWHCALIARWISENPPGRGTGWEPYPTSLRIVNWGKWLLAGREAPAGMIDSLGTQARWLATGIEHHLGGNHLLANAKGLIFAGGIFQGAEADGWLKRGQRLLWRELDEQILPDGGHYERSPLYHALALEDLCDLVNLSRARAGRLDANLVRKMEAVVAPMRRWLRAMSHPDGEITFFNDAAIGISPSPAALETYAGRLGLASEQIALGTITHLEHSGYLRVAQGRTVALLDVATVGPDHQPGHAHADTLSFELSRGERRILVNSGTSEYEAGAERQRQRGTAAHNTVAVDGEDSSEVWAAFRVARRARPSEPQVRVGRVIEIGCSHDGYGRLPGRPIHHRRWCFEREGDGLLVEDRVSGRPRPAEARYHFAPGIRLALDAAGGTALCGSEPVLRWRVEAGSQRLEGSTYHPQFGLSLPNQCLVVGLGNNGARVRFDFAPARAEIARPKRAPELAG